MLEGNIRTLTAVLASEKQERLRVAKQRDALLELQRLRTRRFGSLLPSRELAHIPPSYIDPPKPTATAPAADPAEALAIWNANYSPSLADVRLRAIRRISAAPPRQQVAP